MVEQLLDLVGEDARLLGQLVERGLPAELRLHVYSFLLPPERRIILRPRSQVVRRPRLNIMRANRQLHDEVIKYFYKNWRLFVRVDSSPLGRLRQGEVCRR